MRKRILSIFTALCLCCTLLPTTALAADFDSDWTALTASHSGQTLTGGKYYLNENITISSTILITGDVTLDLNGHTLTYQNEGTKGSVLKVGDGGKNNGNLTLQDSGTGGTITGGTGIIGTGDTTGGGVYVSSGSSFTMTGGTITGCQVTANGGGVCAFGTFTMSGGTIENCTATSDGGGVYVNNYVTFTMSGTAAISSCSAKNGGAVYVNGTLEMGEAGSGTEIGILAGNDDNPNDVYVTENCSIKNAANTTNDACLPIAAKVSLESNSKIEGGKFNGEVDAATKGNNFNITGGTFTATSTVNNSGTISGGTFSGTVNNIGENNSSISGGTFTADSIVNNESSGNIYGGTFNGTVNNKSGGTIMKIENASPTFTGTINNNGTIKDGVNTGSATLKYAVTFDADNGKFDGSEDKKVVYVKKGEAVPDSDIPTPTNTDGSRFMYWYQDKKTTTPFDFAKETITAPITLNAKWSAGSANLPYTTTIAKKEGADAPPQQTFKLEVYTDRFLTEKLETSKPKFILDEAELTTNGDTETIDGKNLTLFWAYSSLMNSKSVYIKQVPDKASADWTYDDTVYYCWYDINNRAFTIYETTESNGNYASTSTTVPTMTFTHTYNYATPVTPTPTPTPTPEPTPTPSTSGGSSGSSRHSVSASHAANGSVSISPKRAIQGESVTITVKPDSGYLLESLTVLNSSGKKIELTDQGNGKFTFIMPRGDVKIEPIFVEEPAEEPIEEEEPTETPAEEPAGEHTPPLHFFTDVSPVEYYYDAVLWAAENGITGGIDETHFAPNQPCSRAQIVTFLWRAAGCPEPETTTNPYPDISTDAYYYKAVLWAMEQGITSGTTPTTFSPDDTCTRAQAASFLYRKEQAEDGGFTGAWMFQLPFWDIPEWCYEAIAWCYMNEITGGTAETTFSPDDACTRAQIVTFLYRAR